ncbi:hypothetical protein A2229_05155 [Candidatus Peregrinibacteria bacterium RIFOXYA2_FULL_33_7]|nr:MAG: hypothetical protein A2229_05155 [Candidatus Peregrinibacteria bacterium RIFOXYA2_FULL_33_7]
MSIKKDLNTKKEQETVQKKYSECQKISIDYAIMEKVPTSLVRIIPADFGWSDVGTWASLHDELTHHHEENIEKGLNLLLDTEGSLIYNEEKEKLIACFGLKDQIIVNTRDALLICPKNKSADLKKMIEKIQEEKKKFM